MADGGGSGDEGLMEGLEGMGDRRVIRLGLLCVCVIYGP